MNHEPSWRKPAGIFMILGLITALAILVGSFSGPIGRLPVLAQVAVYLFAGTIWIAPLRPLLLWMETGKWRE